MKSLAIALKDLTRSFRSAFALIFMFGVPLLVTGMFYLMFGNPSSGGGFDLPRTRVAVVNLDRGDPQAGHLGETVVEAFNSPELAGLLEIVPMDDPVSARTSVDAGQTGVAVILPADFSSSFTDSNAGAEIEFYQDPTLTVGPAIVKTVLRQITDSLAGVKITVALALKQAEAGQIEYSQINQIVAAYLDEAGMGSSSTDLVDLRRPAASPETNFMATMIGSIMAGMMIFYAFFTGVNTASSILREDEDGTLRRLFTTPTAQAEVLGGKFLSVGLTVLVQVAVLLIAARLIFGIAWGALPSAALAAFAIVCSASAFGVLICSLLKNSKQGGIVYGGVLTVTGMVGMVDIFTGNAGGSQFGIVPLFTPQGWAARGMLLSMNGASVAQILPYVLALLAMSALFFAIGVWRFQKRYA